MAFYTMWRKIKHYVIPPESVRRKLFDEAHSDQFGGHLRDAKMHRAYLADTIGGLA